MIAAAIRDDCGGKREEYKELRKQEQAAENANIKVFSITPTWVWKLHTEDKKGRVFYSKNTFFVFFFRSCVVFPGFGLYRSASER